MHDFHIANHVSKLILENAEKSNLKKVTKAVIRLGTVVEHDEQVKPENLIFNVRILLKNSIAEDLEVQVIPVEGDSWELEKIEGEE